MRIIKCLLLEYVFPLRWNILYSLWAIFYTYFFSSRKRKRKWNRAIAFPPLQGRPRPFMSWWSDAGLRKRMIDLLLKIFVKIWRCSRESESEGRWRIGRWMAEGGRKGYCWLLINYFYTFFYNLSSVWISYQNPHLDCELELELLHFLSKWDVVKM